MGKGSFYDSSGFPVKNLTPSSFAGEISATKNCATPQSWSRTRCPHRPLTRRPRPPPRAPLRPTLPGTSTRGTTGAAPAAPLPSVAVKVEFHEGSLLGKRLSFQSLVRSLKTTRRRRKQRSFLWTWRASQRARNTKWFDVFFYRNPPEFQKRVSPPPQATVVPIVLAEEVELFRPEPMSMTCPHCRVQNAKQVGIRESMLIIWLLATTINFWQLIVKNS